jgi:hypothetical protein
MKANTYIFFILSGIVLTFDYSFATEKNKPVQNDIIILSDKRNYSVGDKVKLTITNNNIDKDFVWTGNCGLTLEKYTDGTWEENECPWSGCPLCGIEREIPMPLFLTHERPTKISWDQKIACCVDGKIDIHLTSGRFRFSLGYAEDAMSCKSSDNQFLCWYEFEDKRWIKAYSNEFSVGGKP